MQSGFLQGQTDLCAGSAGSIPGSTLAPAAIQGPCTVEFFAMLRTAEEQLTLPGTTRGGVLDTTRRSGPRYGVFFKTTISDAKAMTGSDLACGARMP